MKAYSIVRYIGERNPITFDAYVFDPLNRLSPSDLSNIKQLYPNKTIIPVLRCEEYLSPTHKLTTMMVNGRSIIVKEECTE